LVFKEIVAAKRRISPWVQSSADGEKQPGAGLDNKSPLKIYPGIVYFITSAPVFGSGIRVFGGR
jgi:hypothetical protein